MPPTPTSSPRERILVVAPTEDEWGILEAELTRRSYESFRCQQPRDALAYVSQQTVDIILFSESILDGADQTLFALLRDVARDNGISVLPIFCLSPNTWSPQHDLRPAQNRLVATEKYRQINRKSLLACRSPKPNGDAEHIVDHVPIIGRSSQIKDLLNTIRRIADLPKSVLITGATGTGKELAARTIHSQSKRGRNPFVDVNCSAVPETLFEAEFFGHERGTFTGAHQTRPGLFEVANGGTLFLDEIESLSLPNQAKLLRVLQERQIRRVGGRENIPVDARVIAATNADLRTSIARGEFRADLFFRLRVVPLHLPKLSERKGDIQLLVNYFLSQHIAVSGKRLHFSPKAMETLLAHHWPGNVRELENVIEYAVAVSTGDIIGIDELPKDLFYNEVSVHNVPGSPAKQGVPLADVEREHILLTLESCGGHQMKAAELLGIDRRTLYRKLQQYSIKGTVGRRLVGL